MRQRIVWGLLLAGILLGAVGADAPAVLAQEEELIGKPTKFVDGNFWIYSDYRNRNNNYIPSGWMGDYGDIKMNENWKENPYSGTTSLKFSYSAAGRQGAYWAGVFWQNPANNWGSIKGGFDLREAKRLTFWARGEKGDERIMEFRVGGISGTYSDSDEGSIGPIDLTAEWQQYTIDLEDLDLSYIMGGFCWVTNADANPEGAEFYLDDIRFER